MKWWNLLLGILKIKITGMAVERFLNICIKQGIHFSNIEADENCYCAYIKLKNFYEIKAAARKTKTRVVILKRYGFPFFVDKLKKKKCFLLGLICTLLFLFYSSGVIWKIEINGNHKLTEEGIRKWLQESDINVGKKIDDINIEKIEKGLRNRFEDIVWTSVKVDGTILKVDLKENELIRKNAEDKNSETEDIKNRILAPYDGRICRIMVRNGIPLVKYNEIVKKGQVLVEGTIPIKNDDDVIIGYIETVADADIEIEHKVTYEVNTNINYIEKKYSGRNKTELGFRYQLEKYPLIRKDNYIKQDVYYEEHKIAILDLVHIPVYFYKQYKREYYLYEHNLDVEMCEDMLSKKLEHFLSSLEEKGVQIIEKDVKIDSSGEVCKLICQMVLIEKILNETENFWENK